MRLQFGHQDCLALPSPSSLDELVHQLNDLLGDNAYTIERNGRKVSFDEEHSSSDDETYKIWPKVLGGKGGFGSLLRSFGKSILISKNKEACRDLNGRRMRDVNNEKKLKEWMQKQLEKSVSGSADQKSSATASSSAGESNDYRSVAPPHKFSDSGYDEQKKQISEDIDESVQIAAELMQAEKSKKKKQSSTAVSTRDADEDDADRVETVPKKRRHSNETLEDGELMNIKKKKEEKGGRGSFFLGIDLGDVSSDDEDDEDQGKAKSVMKKKS